MICDICMYDSYTYAVMHFQSHVCNHFGGIFLGIRFALVLLCKSNTKWRGCYFLVFWNKNGIRAAPNRVAFRARRWSVWVDSFCFGTVCNTAITRYARGTWAKQAITCMFNSPVMQHLIRHLIRYLIRSNQAFNQATIMTSTWFESGINQVIRVSIMNSTWF